MWRDRGSVSRPRRASPPRIRDTHTWRSTTCPCPPRTHTGSGTDTRIRDTHTRIRDTHGFGTHVHADSGHTSTDPGRTRIRDTHVAEYKDTRIRDTRPRIRDTHARRSTVCRGIAEQSAGDSDPGATADRVRWRSMAACKDTIRGIGAESDISSAARDQSGAMAHRTERRLPPQLTRVFIADGQTGDSRWQRFLPRLQSTPPSPVDQTLPRPVGALSPTKHCQPRRRPARPRRRRCIERAG